MCKFAHPLLSYRKVYIAFMLLNPVEIHIKRYLYCNSYD